MLQVSVDETQNITATFTDISGNTSEFAVFGTISPLSPPVTDDSDADGGRLHIRADRWLDPDDHIGCAIVHFGRGIVAGL